MWDQRYSEPGFAYGTEPNDFLAANAERSTPEGEILASRRRRLVSIWCHTPAGLRARLHRSVVAALRPGGVFLLESYTPKQLEYKTGGPSTAKLMMTLAAVRVEAGAFDSRELQGPRCRFGVGTGHAREAARQRRDWSNPR